MEVKKSIFINRVEIKGKIYYFNSLTNALIELSSYEYENNMLDELKQLEGSNVDLKNKYLKLGFLVNKNLNEEKIVEYNYQKNKFDKHILSLDLFPTYLCNLSCEYCFLKKNWIEKEFYNKKLIEKYFISVSNFINYSKSDKIHINIFGGEPLMNADIIEYTINYIENELKPKQKIVYSIDTNGTINIKRKLWEKMTVNVSIDGIKNYHDKYRLTRDNKPTYDIIKSNLKRIKNAFPKFRYGIQSTYTPEMFRNKVKLSDIFKNLSRDFSPTRISINPTSFVKNFKLDLYEFYKTSIDALFDNYEKKHFIGDKSMMLWIFMVLKGIKTDYICPAGTKSLTISYNGDIYPCHLLMEDKYKISNVNNFKTEEIKEHLEKFNLKYKEMFKHTKGKCTDCWIRYFCIGCIAKFRLVTSKNPEFCKLTKKLFSHLLLKLAQIKQDKTRWEKFIDKIQVSRREKL